MNLKTPLAAMMLCAAAISNGAQAQPAATHQQTAPAQRPVSTQQQARPAPTQEPVQYQLLLASSVLLLIFGGRRAANVQPWSNN